MCDSGQFIFRKEIKCSLCGTSPSARTDEYSDDYDYCRECALEIFGQEIFSESFEEEGI
ncbi:hypothetical protein LCGC14_1368270 [marine sediment metagenome]|uniref:Uncharacterized protein n=1 Tax=marine sediment metagenome TaxID=412755 RepID=A0A0F9KS32_9ZZZZ